MTGNTIPATPTQQQDYSNLNDGLYRWMPSINVDGSGDMAIGYSTSSMTVNPGIRYVGRLASDPLNMVGPEAIMTAATGHQTSTGGRWGDYTSMFVDPTDSCTFYHTNEDLLSNQHRELEVPSRRIQIRFLYRFTEPNSNFYPNTHPKCDPHSYSESDSDSDTHTRSNSNSFTNTSGIGRPSDRHGYGRQYRADRLRYAPGGICCGQQRHPSRKYRGLDHGQYQRNRDRASDRDWRYRSELLLSPCAA